MWFRQSALALLLVLISSELLAGSTSRKTYSVRWQERNGAIVHDSVCYNYPEGSIEYRGCRAQAKRYFTLQCRALTEKYEKTRAPYNRTYSADRQKFCYSADAFFPL